jgi:hypothetical protein
MRQVVQIPEKIVSFLNQQSGQSFCDACIQRECMLNSARQVARVTAILALSPDYRRVKGECSRCESTKKLATRAV